MPVLVGLGALLALIAVIALWPDSDADDAKAAKRAKAGAGSKAQEGDDDGSLAAGQAAGVAARTYDEPSAPGRSGRMNPAIRLPSVGMAPPEGGASPPADDKPPVFENVAQEIAWYEARLERANKTLESRKKFFDRLPEVRDRIAKGPDPQRQLEVFEGRKKIVEDNYTKAQADVAEIERKLKELRG